MEQHHLDASTRTRLSHFQSLYAHVERDNAELSVLADKLEGMRERLDELSAYYDTQWVSDHEEIDSFPSDEGSYSILSEDAIYNEIYARRTILRELKSICDQMLAER